MSLFMKSHNKTHRSNSVIHCSNTSTWLLQKPLVVTSFRDDTIAGGIFGHEQYDPDDDVGCGGSASNAFCPGGYVCERPWVILPCSEGHYCPVGVSEGTKCDLFSLCPQGTVRPMSYFLTIIFFSAIGILLLFIFFAKMVYSCSSRPQQQKNRTNLVSTTNQQTRDKALYKCDHIIDFTFKDLYLEIPECCSKKKVLLESVTGHLESGKITAIMGPSGAGKTTLLDVLAGRKTSGFIRRGKLLINGANEPISKFSKEIGYVPQEDTMYRSLTPRENLQYSAQLRLKASVTAEERNNLVNEVLIMLDIYDKADDRIGDVEEKGLSGGQLKRVNIGMELVAKPSVLFLDEPTSGLDSSTSLIVLEALQNIAHKGDVNVMAVVHQPRYEIFKQLDKLVLLCKGGRTAYVGKASEALGHCKFYCSLAVIL
jgi:ABC-type multidrug transport system ATPase subunit